MGRSSNRLLVGLGGTATSDVISQRLSIDVFERYLPDFGPGANWTEFDSPPGTYVDIVTQQADSVGAVPMFTLYAMALSGDGVLSTLDSKDLMRYYWSHVVLLFDRLAVYNKPVLVNLEPDFWGYVQNQATANDPNQRFAWVNVTSDCTSLPNTAVGVAQCLLRIARNRAPKALVGFPPGDFGAGTANTVQFMNRIGAQNADFIVKQTLDRDAGCFEALSSDGACTGRPEINPYWNDAAFETHLDETRQYHEGIGGLPIVWWQTPLGVPSNSFGTTKHFRDNRVRYFLNNAARLVAVGGAVAVFGAGQDNQTDITTDGGQFQDRLNAYLAHPAALPTTP
ncbi:hypothetical protein B1810_18865 [Panacagrimonas perspica]|nr:hypothetical protein B1810_18865 [Panacagrimonas perspica]